MISGKLPACLIYAVLVAACLAVYGQGLGHDFVTFDDDVYVTNNPHVQNGLTRAGFVWAFTSTKASNWHPLTWLSHELDCQIYGLRPWGHHLTNLLFHTANAILLFLILARMTKNPWPSLMVAALFAVHPLHVESVAWVSERKDVLCAFCWLLATGAYVRYVESPGIARYAALVAFYALGLMAKPMAVTFPFVLLLLDYWPLWNAECGMRNAKWLARRVAGKTPLFVLSLVMCVVTYAVQQQGGSIIAGKSAPLCVRLSNAPVGYVFYLLKMFYPKDLAVYYPHPFIVRPLWQVTGALAVLALVTAVALYARQKRPYLIVGWLWYLGTLVPVIQIVQVGRSAYADRYTYIPLIGVFIMLSWGVADLAKAHAIRGRTIFAAAACTLLALTAAGALQTRYWRDNLTLFTHAMKIAPGDPVAHTNLGLALAASGRTQEAMEHYYAALQREPGYTAARNNLGTLLEDQGRYDEAVAAYRETLRYDPNCVDALNNLGAALVARGRLEEAQPHFDRALQVDPENLQVRSSLAKLFFLEGKYEETIQRCRSILDETPGNADVHIDLGVALAKTGRLDEAVAHLAEAERLDPSGINAFYNLGLVFLYQARYDEAAAQFSEVLRIDPNHPTAREYAEKAKRLKAEAGS